MCDARTHSAEIELRVTERGDPVRHDHQPHARGIDDRDILEVEDEAPVALFDVLCQVLSEGFLQWVRGGGDERRIREGDDRGLGFVQRCEGMITGILIINNP